MKMKEAAVRCLMILSLCAGAAMLLSACGLKIENTGAVKEAEELAINCKTDEALAALDRAKGEMSIAAAIADLQRVVILRDAGRTAEADAAMAERNTRWKADAKNADDAEKSVAQSVEQMRAERQKRTGRRTFE